VNDWANLFFDSDYGAGFAGVEGTVLMMALTFAIGHFIGFIYMWSHEGISYSRSFVASLAVLPVLVSVMMTIMAGNLLVAFGLFAVFGIIRFRNVLKDTRDTAFVLWAILEGVSVGTLRMSTAVVAALGVGLVFVYLRVTSFGTRHRFDAVATLRVIGDRLAVGEQLKQVFRQHARRWTVITERRVNDGGIDLSYHVLLRDTNRCEELQAALAQTDGLSSVAVFLHNDEAEI
jgi:hypothetical protein